MHYAEVDAWKERQVNQTKNEGQRRGSFQAKPHTGCSIDFSTSILETHKYPKHNATNLYILLTVPTKAHRSTNGKKRSRDFLFGVVVHIRISYYVVCPPIYVSSADVSPVSLWICSQEEATEVQV